MNKNEADLFKRKVVKICWVVLLFIVSVGLLQAFVFDRKTISAENITYVKHDK